VLGHGIDPLLAAYDVADLHEMVVHDHREMVGREAVALDQHLVVHGRPGLADLPAQEVGEDALALQGRLHADDEGFARRRPSVRFACRDVPAQPVVARSGA